MSENERYRIDQFHARSLENNPLKSPVERDVFVYLPPGYFESKSQRYPVIYFLHGYSCNNKFMEVYPRLEEHPGIPIELFPSHIRNQIDLERLPSYVQFDELIMVGELAPFIFVQPDGSLHLPQLSGAKTATGVELTKGSMYVNSPYTGQYEDYIVQDVLAHVDATYRTLATKQHRALMGHSMGGYGTMSVCLRHPEKFGTAVALSPANGKFLNLQLVIPLNQQLFGREQAKIRDTNLLNDILDTLDLIYSKETPLFPSLQRDEMGTIVNWDSQAWQNWEKFDLNQVIRKTPKAFTEVPLLLSCEQNDEFGIADEARKLHTTLTELGIAHRLDIYEDPKSALYSHLLGPLYQVVPSIRFCLQHST